MAGLHMTSLRFEREMPLRTKGFAFPRTMSPRRPLLAIHTALMSALAGVGLVYPTLHMEAGSLVYPSCIALILTFVWVLWSWRALRGTIFEPSFAGSARSERRWHSEWALLVRDLSAGSISGNDQLGFPARRCLAGSRQKGGPRTRVSIHWAEPPTRSPGCRKYIPGDILCSSPDSVEGVRLRDYEFRILWPVPRSSIR